MKPFRDLPIQRKMLLMTLLICGAVLFVAIAALFTFQVLNFRSNFQRDTATLAAVIANNSTVALAFKDAKAGAEVVGSLQAKPTVVSACLLEPDGSLFAEFGKPQDAQALREFPPADESLFSGGQFLYTQTVAVDQRRLGTLCLRMDYRQTFLRLLGLYGLVILGVMIVSIGLAVLLSGRLQRSITNPVRQLAETARIVGERKEYSVRAPVSQRGDELGRLTESFNEMLGRIESDDAALRQANHTLEQEIAEHKRTEEALRRSEADKATILAAAQIGIVILDRDTHTILYANTSALALIKRTPEELLGQCCHAVICPAQKGNCPITDLHQEVDHSERMLLDGQGNRVPILKSVVPITYDGRPCLLESFIDLTERKRAEEEVEKLHNELLSVSRQAGMAEVATGVLHNVGNVLNSVSVSATLVSDQLRRSKIANLRRASAMLREQNGRLVEFLTRDPKGKLLPEYFNLAIDQLAGEQVKLIEEMDSVSQHIEHIKEIVAMQQSYARVSGAQENLAVAGLVEDALRMNSAAFERHRIQVVREFDESTPKVCVDRHKVLQILINLLRNAKYAMDGQAAHEKRLVIRVGTASPDRVKVTVRDHGVGIAPENLIKIFGHGFTTKKDGHGFGLHSGANAAKEMGGSLTAYSDGVGLGAEFVLELPVATRTRNEAMTSNPENK